jgi:predicted transcriptional regulator
MASELSSESSQYLRQAVESGAYRSEAQALEQAIALLKQRDALRAQVAAGVQQADSGELLTAEFVFERLETRARLIESRVKE